MATKMRIKRILTGMAKWEVLIPVAFLCLYLTYLNDISDEPFFKYLVVNPLVYDSDARQILQGIPSRQPFFLSPIFPGWLASIYFVTGSSRLAVAVTNGLVGMLSIYLISAIAMETFGKKASRVASVLAFGYWSLYYFCGELMPTVLCISAVLASTYCIIKAENKSIRVPLIVLGLISIGFVSHINPAIRGLRAKGQYYDGNPKANLAFAVVFIAGAALNLAIFSNSKLRDKLRFPVGGLLSGLSMLLWSGTALYSILLTAYIMIKRAAKSAKIGWLFALLVPIAASTCHNYAITKDLIPLTTSFGVNLFIGNNPSSDGMNPFKLGEANRVRIEADRKGLSGKARSDFFKDKAVDFMRDHKIEWIKLVGRKTLISLSRVEVDNNADISERRESWRLAPIAFVNFGIIFPLACVGLVLTLRDSQRGLLLFFGFLCFMLTQVTLFSCERFRIPGSTLLIPLAGYGALSVVQQARKGDFRSLLTLAVVAFGAGLVSNYDFLSLSEVEFPAIVANKAYVERLDGNLEKAADFAMKAIDMEPTNASAYFQLGAIEEHRGNLEKAIGYYLISLKNDPFFIASYNGARRILVTLRISPGYLDSYINDLVQSEQTDEKRTLIESYVKQRLQEIKQSKDR